MLCQVQLTLWCGHERVSNAKTHPPPVPAGFVKIPLGPPLPGRCQTRDGALGLSTPLRHIITERWIRSYLRSAFSQSSLATQPPRYKYTLEMCTASYSQWKPSEAGGGSEAWGGAAQILPGSKDVTSEILRDARVPAPPPANKYGTHQIECL